MSGMSGLSGPADSTAGDPYENGQDDQGHDETEYTAAAHRELSFRSMGMVLMGGGLNLAV